jgi:hypothetical protein
MPVPGAWKVRCADSKGGSWIKSFAIADDQENADNANVLTFWQASDKAKQLARGQDADAGRPATVGEALDEYATDLAVRGGRSTNASQPRYHLTPSLLSKPVYAVRASSGTASPFRVSPQGHSAAPDTIPSSRSSSASPHSRLRACLPCTYQLRSEGSPGARSKSRYYRC